MGGQYETGIPPQARGWSPGDDPNRMCKIDQPHYCDRTIHELISHPAIGGAAARITGAKMIRVFAVQLLHKPPGGQPDTSVGWHQDRQYWTKWWDEATNALTAWVAISDVKPDSGPVLFLRASHRWGFLNQGDFCGKDLDALRKDIDLPDGAVWDEVPGLLEPGAVSFHHRLIYHGSRPNLSESPRRSFAIHLRTEDSRPIPGADHHDLEVRDDEHRSPIIHRA